jgi:hypothetical protein
MADGTLDIVATIDVDAWMQDRLEENDDLDTEYVEWCESEGLPLGYRSALRFATEVKNGKGIYGDDSGPLTVNTYNGEDLLSSILQYVYWQDEDGVHVLLEKHAGGDARGNYHAPQAYDVTDYDGTSIFDNARASIYCNDCGKYWDSDNGCHWRPEGCSGQELQDYPATDDRPDYPERPNPAQRTLPIDLPERPEPNTGVVWVDDDRNGHCPYCGGLLHVAPWPAG